MGNGRDFAPVTHGIPMSTSNIKVGKGIGINSGNRIVWRSTTLHTSIGVTAHDTMGDFPLRPPAPAKSQRKLRPLNFKTNLTEPKIPITIWPTSSRS